MASRVIEAGTIVTRVQQLLSCGVLKERPLWLDVVERFPPLTTPQYNRKPEPGRPLTLRYQQDRLVKNFKEKYELLKGGKPYNQKPVISLFEDHRGNDGERPPSLVESIVKEQMRLMALGKSKGESLAAAVGVVSASNKELVFKPKTPTSLNEPGQETTQLEKAVMEMQKILSTK